jgi:hypothetical protein
MGVCAVAVLLASSAITPAQQPDNAALLYYQAFLLYEKPDAAMDKMLTSFRKGEIASNDAIDKFMEKNRPVIDMVVRAASIDECDWGYDYSQGVELSMPNLSRVRQLAFLLSANARWLADQGNYQTALDRCLVMRKMGLQVCDKTLISYLVGTAVDALANSATEQVLGSAPPDANVLSRFKADLARIGARFPSAATSLAQESEVCAMTMTHDKMQTQIQLAHEMGTDMASDAVTKRLQQGDEAFYKRNREFYLRMMRKLTSVLEANLSYAKTNAAIDELAGQLNEQMKDDPDATLASLALDPASVKRIYQLSVRRRTHFNAIMAAIDLYIAVAREGRLPASLPPDSPVDLFSGKPFTYAKTADGFVLRCQAKETSDKEPEEYAFKVKK